MKNGVKTAADVLGYSTLEGIMRKPRSALAKLFSFNQHRKRFGAAEVSDAIDNVDYETLKNTIIDADNIQFTHGANKNINEHIADLKKEFHGQSELCYYHAQLVVLIRRDYEPKQTFTKFLALWNDNQDFLIKNLSTRWLISAADTFIDCSDNAIEAAVLINAAILVNTLKLQETERYLTQTQDAAIDSARKEKVQTERLALFDGTSGFAIGTDDTLRNMRWRLEKVCQLHPRGAIVIEVFDRVQNCDTVYRRFKENHTREKTAWW